MNPHAMMAAHLTLPFGTMVTVTSVTGRCVAVRINDRGPFVRGRCIGLSYGAVRTTGVSGSARVRVERWPDPPQKNARQGGARAQVC